MDASGPGEALHPLDEDAAMAEQASHEWEALREAHDHLAAEFQRLERQDPVDVPAHRALVERLREHQRRIVAWRARYLPQR